MHHRLTSIVVPAAITIVVLGLSGCGPAVLTPDTAALHPGETAVALELRANAVDDDCGSDPYPLRFNGEPVLAQISADVGVGFDLDVFAPKRCLIFVQVPMPARDLVGGVFESAGDAERPWTFAVDAINAERTPVLIGGPVVRGERYDLRFARPDELELLQVVMADDAGNIIAAVVDDGPQGHAFVVPTTAAVGDNAVQISAEGTMPIAVCDGIDCEVTPWFRNPRIDVDVR